MDRCALFVDASYVLADGAMAVHGTRRGESVSWDYEGLLQLLSVLARERTGLPLLRCYWYEATVDGRRTAEQDALADIPGIKLRVAKIRPGRREGVETEIHRDLTTLARNGAVSDALVVSAEEDLAQVIADVQDLGMRVTLVHIAVDGNWTISRSLRQESDDILEIGGEQLRPYVELIVGAEPAHADEPDDADRMERAPGRLLANGHSAVAGVGSYQPPAIYTAPVVAEYQRPALQLPRATGREAREERAREERAREDRAREERAREERAREERAREERAREERAREERAREERPREDRGARETVNGEAPSARPDIYAAPGPLSLPAPPRTQRPDRQERPEPESLSGTEAAQASPGQLRRLPSRPSSPAPLGPMGSPPSGPHGGQGSAAHWPLQRPAADRHLPAARLPVRGRGVAGRGRPGRARRRPGVRRLGGAGRPGAVAGSGAGPQAADAVGP